MNVPPRIGFSKARGFFGYFSDIICWATGAPFSHTWLLVDHGGVDVVYEAATVGFRAINYDIWKKTDEMVELWQPAVSLAPAMDLVYKLLGQSYDFLGLAGMSFVEAGRDYLHRKVNNPWHHHNALFCSEVVAKVMKDTRVAYPNVSHLVPYNTDPLDIKRTLMMSSEAKCLYSQRGF